jgi:hypothetical protein
LTVVFLTLPLSCKNIDVVTASYSTLAEARDAGAIERGWIPRETPAGAHDIREAHDADTNRRWGLFSFLPADTEPLRAMLQQDEWPLAGVRCDIPGRIEWWPILLRGALDPEELKNAGLKAYRARRDNLIVAVNWNQGRAYYWSD